jgi:putative methanogenesis marker protein 8
VRKSDGKVQSPEGTHEIYCCGAKVRVSEKGIRVLTEPRVKYCPLHESIYGTGQIGATAVRKTVEAKIRRFGFCCRNRSFDVEPIVAYGASEMMQVWLKKKLIDCTVVVCEGAGTVIASNSRLVQAVGARLTGVVRTSPIRAVIEHIEADGGIVLDRASSRIDQTEGVKRALALGFEHVAVTVAGFQAKVIDEIRDFQSGANADVLVFSVCNTCVKATDVKYLSQADLVCASASRILRKEIGKTALLQLGVTIPVYALTRKGKNLALAYLAEFKDPLVIFRTRRMPYAADKTGPQTEAVD